MASADKDKLGADLSAYLDGELGPERVREVERLLAESAEARRTLEALRSISEGLAGLPRLRAPVDLSSSVSRGRVQSTRSSRGSSAGWARVYRLVTRISGAAALVLLGVFAGWAILHRAESPAPGGDERGFATRGNAGVAEDEAKPLAKRVAPDLTDSVGAAGLRIAEMTPDDAPAIAMGETSDAALGEEYEGLVAGRGGKGGRASGAVVRSKEPVTAARDAIAASAATGTESLAPDATLEGTRITGGTPVVAGYPATGDAPVYNLVVAPRNDDEYHASLSNVARWQRASPVIAGQTIGDDFTGDSYRAGRVMRGTPVVARKDAVTAARQDFTIEIPTDEFDEVLSSFEREVPQQVQVVMNFPARDLEQVRRMVVPEDAPASWEETERFAGAKRGPAREIRGSARGGAADAAARVPAEPATEEARRFAVSNRGRRSRVVENSAEPSEKARAKKEELDEAERVLAYKPREALGAGALRQLEALGYVGDSVESAVDAEVEERLVESVVRAPSFELPAPADPRRPRVEEVAVSVPTDSKPVRMQAGLGVAEFELVDQNPTPPPPSFGRALREQAAAFQAHLEEMYEIMIGDAFRESPSTARTAVERLSAAPTVTVQITLLPPGSSPPTLSRQQPATRPANSSTPETR